MKTLFKKINTHLQIKEKNPTNMMKNNWLVILIKMISGVLSVLVRLPDPLADRRLLGRLFLCLMYETNYHPAALYFFHFMLKLNLSYL